VFHPTATAAPNAGHDQATTDPSCSLCRTGRRPVPRYRRGGLGLRPLLGRTRVTRHRRVHRRALRYPQPERRRRHAIALMTRSRPQTRRPRAGYARGGLVSQSATSTPDEVSASPDPSGGACRRSMSLPSSSCNWSAIPSSSSGSSRSWLSRGLKFTTSGRTDSSRAARSAGVVAVWSWSIRSSWRRRRARAGRPFVGTRARHHARRANAQLHPNP
jgi:hypothetical protein